MKFDSKLIHAGWDSDADSEGSITVPIYKTTAYQSYPEVWNTMGMTRGKWYCEYYVTGGSNGPTVSGGIKVQTMQPASDGGPGVGYQNPPDSKGTSGGSSPGYGSGTLVGIAYDAYKGLSLIHI